MFSKSKNIVIVVQIISFLLLSNLLFSNNKNDELHITLDKKSIYNDCVGGWIACFDPNPPKMLILPEIDKLKTKYFIDIYVGFEQGKTSNPKDLNISAMVVPDENGELLYIDDNKDMDLTNDEGPYHFLSNQNQFYHTIRYNKNPDQKIEILLQRNADSNAPVLIDETGNLIEIVLDMAHNKIPDYEGKKGTFYYNEQLQFSYAIIDIDSIFYKFGLSDMGFNGLYNDKNDLLIIEVLDKNQHKLKRETYKQNEIFKIGDDNYKLSYIDPYGKTIKIKQTDESTNFHYTHKLEDINGQTSKGILYSTFWNLKVTAIDNEIIDFNQLKNQYLLLNFWGEWCKGCIMEIPEIVDIYKKYPQDKLKVVSFLKTAKFEIAQKYINDYEMNWPQIIINKEIQNNFRLDTFGYPANILVFPDGKTYLQSKESISEYIIF